MKTAVEDNIYSTPYNCFACCYWCLQKKKENSELSYSSVLVTKQWLLFNEGYKSEGGFNRTMKVRYDFLIFSDYLPLRYLLKIGFKT